MTLAQTTQDHNANLLLYDMSPYSSKIKVIMSSFAKQNKKSNVFEWWVGEFFLGRGCHKLHALKAFIIVITLLSNGQTFTWALRI